MEDWKVHLKWRKLILIIALLCILIKFGPFVWTTYNSTLITCNGIIFNYWKNLFLAIFTMPPDSRGSVAVNYIKQFPFLEAFDIFVHTWYVCLELTPLWEEKWVEWKKNFNIFLFSYLWVLIKRIERLFFCLENSKISSNFINKLVLSYVLCACNEGFFFWFSVIIFLFFFKFWISFFWRHKLVGECLIL